MPRCLFFALLYARASACRRPSGMPFSHALLASVRVCARPVRVLQLRAAYLCAAGGAQAEDLPCRCTIFLLFLWTFPLKITFTLKSTKVPLMPLHAKTNEYTHTRAHTHTHAGTHSCW